MKAGFIIELDNVIPVLFPMPIYNSDWKQAKCGATFLIKDFKF